MHGVQKMTMWRGKPIAGLKGGDLDKFREDMAKMGARSAFAPAIPDKRPPASHAKTNLRGK